MTSKRQELYELVLNRLKEVTRRITGREIHPRFVVSDYELGLLQALSNAFPGSRASGCWFHSGQVSIIHLSSHHHSHSSTVLLVYLCMFFSQYNIVYSSKVYS